MFTPIVRLIKVGLQTLRSLFQNRKDLALENLAFRQQLSIYAQKEPKPRTSASDKLFWVLMSRSWSRWQNHLIIVKPETVIRWHRAGFRLYWRWISKRDRRVGRPPVTAEVRELIDRMVKDNPSWGAPRIHGELLKLGFKVGQATVSRLMPPKPANPEKSQRWRTFLRNHSDVIAAMDFFVVPTATFGLLFGFFIIEHARRKVLHFNVTANPTAEWVIQQLREAFPYETAIRYLIMDRDSIFNGKMRDCLRTMGIEPVRISARAPQENGIAERWIGSLRRDLLDHVIILNERHLRRLVRLYIRYYQEDRTHLSLAKDTPAGRPVMSKPSADASVVAVPRIGGLHHRYEWQVAA
jgi:putative transposase